jgi:hypothetical protein
VPVSAQNAQQYSEDEVRAVFLYRFTGFIEWPPLAESAPDFTIAVFDAAGVADVLGHLLAGHSIKDKPAQVRQISRVQDLGDARIVYVGAADHEQLAALAAAVADRPILIVTNDERGLQRGGTINFVSMDRHVRFEVSLTAASRAGLKISSELLAVATRVIGPTGSLMDSQIGTRVACVLTDTQRRRQSSVTDFSDARMGSPPFLRRRSG